MLLQDAEPILHRHLVAGERQQLDAKRDVQVVQRSPYELQVRTGRLRRCPSSPLGSFPTPPSARDQAPSVTGPERFRRPAASGRTPYPFGEPALRPAAFQSAINLRSVCLRGSGAVAPSAPANARTK